MKKQILILTFFALALIAGTSRSFGQATHNSSPEAAVSCTNDALHPIAGKPYDYSVTTDPTGGNYLWWATTNTSFITAGTLNNGSALTSPDVVATTPANYNASTTSNTVQLTWGTNVLAAATGAGGTPTFVAVHYTPPSGGGCADNLKVYQIEPVNAFTVDITNVKDDDLTSLAYGAAEDQCFDDVQGASWSGNAMTYDYGTNVLIFEVVAANFTGTWTPTFQLSGLDALQSATMVWDYDVNFSGTPVTVTSGTASATPVSTSVTDTSNGVSIYVKVTIANGTYEGIADQNISLAVTGTNSAGQSDVVASDCSTAVFADNTATQTLNERPEVIDNTDVGTFE